MAKRRKRLTKAKKKKILQEIIGTVVFCLFLAIFGKDYILTRTATPLPVQDYENTLTVLDVGQAKCSLIQSGGQFCLIDAGFSGGKTDIVSYLNSRGVKEIELFVLSHFHSDHTSQANDILKNFKVKAVLIPDLSEKNMPTTTFFTKLLERAEKGEFDLYTAKKDLSFPIGGGTFKVGGDTNNTGDINNTSIVSIFSQGEFVYVDTGDAGKATEELVLNDMPQNITVFNSAHHGSKDANSFNFLQRLRPKYVAIPCGEGNSYGHPHKDTLDTYNKLLLPYNITWEEGNLVYSMTTLERLKG